MKSKSPVYAALDLHSRHSVLGSMEHGGKTGARMRLISALSWRWASRQFKRPCDGKSEPHKKENHGDL